MSLRLKRGNINQSNSDTELENIESPAFSEPIESAEKLKQQQELEEQRKQFQESFQNKAKMQTEFITEQSKGVEEITSDTVEIKEDVKPKRSARKSASAKKAQAAVATLANMSNFNNFSNVSNLVSTPKSASSKKPKTPKAIKSVEAKFEVKEKDENRWKSWSKDEELFLVGSVLDRFFKRGSLSSTKTDDILNDDCWSYIKSCYDKFWQNYSLLTGKNVPPERSANALCRHYKVMKARISQNDKENLNTGEDFRLYFEEFQKHFNIDNWLLKDFEEIQSLIGTSEHIELFGNQLTLLSLNQNKVQLLTTNNNGLNSQNETESNNLNKNYFNDTNINTNNNNNLSSLKSIANFLNEDAEPRKKRKIAKNKNDNDKEEETENEEEFSTP